MKKCSMTFMFVIYSLINLGQQTGTFTDPRDGKVYKTVKIDNLIWMAENLNYNTNSGSWCYDDNSSNFKNYGRLYNYETAIKVCPTGWHLPSDKEWDILVEQIDSKKDNLFNLQLAGNRRGDYIGEYQYKNGTYEHMGIRSYFWASNIYYKHMTSYRIGGFADGLWRLAGYGNRETGDKESAFSVRCVCDNNSNNSTNSNYSSNSNSIVTYSFPNGSKYVGSIVNGKFDGAGKYYLSGGILRYDGNWKNDKMNGFGTYIEDDGSKYVGNFVNDKYEGNGKYYYPDGNLEYSGEWKNGLFNGGGTIYENDGSYISGYFIDSGLNGNASLYDNNDTWVYDGVFKNSELIKITRKNQTIKESDLSKWAVIGGIILAGALIYNDIKGNSTSPSSSNNAYSSTNSDNSKTDLYILSIGISDYQDNNCAPDLDYAHIDAIDIAERLKKGDGNSNLYSNVNTKILTNGNATKANIIDAINSIRSKANKNDVIIISISSHGDINSNNGTFYLTPNDFNCSNEFSSSINLDLIVKGIDCENCATIIWLDACHAGGAGTDFYKKLDDYARNKQGQNINLLVSSDDSETSLESSRWGHGAFSKAILDGLNGNADQNSNGIISLRELTEYVMSRVPSMTNYKQHPYNPVKLFPNTRLSTY